LRCENSRISRKTEREYLKGIINDLETNNKNRDIRDLQRTINEFKRGYEPRTDIKNYENGNLIADH
jgi:hypothetical protein